MRSLGAQRVIDYATTDFAAEGLTYDVIVECVGNAPFERVAPILRRGGALLLVIADLKGMLGTRRNSRRSGALVTYQGAKLTAGEALRRMTELAESGALVPVIDSVHPLADVVAGASPRRHRAQARERRAAHGVSHWCASAIRGTMVAIGPR